MAHGSVGQQEMLEGRCVPVSGSRENRLQWPVAVEVHPQGGRGREGLRPGHEHFGKRRLGAFHTSHSRLGSKVGCHFHRSAGMLSGQEIGAEASVSTW